MFLQLLSTDSAQETTKPPGQLRRRTTSPSKMDSRNYPSDLYLVQVHSTTIRKKIQEHNERMRSVKRRMSSIRPQKSILAHRDAKDDRSFEDILE